MKVTLEGRTFTLPWLHCMVIGMPNCGKTHFAASAETPMIVLAPDPFSKMMPYVDRGVLDPVIYTGPQGQPTRLVRNPTTGNALIQIESYYDEDDTLPVAGHQFATRIPQIVAEVKQGRWKTVVIDSWSQLEWIMRLRRTNGPFAEAGTSPYLSAMDDLTSIVNARLMNLPSNLIITFHIETKTVKDRKGQIVKDSKSDMGGGVQSYNIAAIGGLKNIGRVLGECYLGCAPTDGTDNYTLQTKRDVDFMTLCSRINAPNPCKNEWKELFANWLTKQLTIPELPPPVEPAA